MYPNRTEPSLPRDASKVFQIVACIHPQQSWGSRIAIVPSLLRSNRGGFCTHLQRSRAAVNSTNSRGYVVGVNPSRTAEAIRDIHKALFAVNPMRHMPEPSAGIHSFSEARARAFGHERGIALLMSVICVILLSVTVAGIVGLTSLWVGQRTRQIGVRRAIGARKIDILRYFQIENLLLTGGGAVVGTLFAFGLSEWLMRQYETMRLPPLYVAIGVVAMLVLGQAAVLVPARRASNVPPFVAARSA